MYKFVSDKYVAKRYGIGRSTVWYWVKMGRLPKPYKLAANTTRFKIEELDESDKQKNVI